MVMKYAKGVLQYVLREPGDCEGSSMQHSLYFKTLLTGFVRAWW